jgi:glycosyltransferase involved in cell wall biosynthesis
MPIISIIVPIYNAEKYLVRCIDSILNQSFTDFECILVNDGSTDNSALMCENYVKKDNRIVVIHKENGGVSSARNVGLKTAKGEYVCFVDSDDMVKSTYVENLMVGDFDIVVTGCTHVYEKKIHTALPDSFETKNFSRIKLCFLDLERLILLNCVYLKKYKSQIIRQNDISFDVECSHGEDTLFVFSYLQYCKSIKVVNKSDYLHYVEIEGSLSKKILSLTVNLNYAKRMYCLRKKVYAIFGTTKQSQLKIIDIMFQTHVFRAIYLLFLSSVKRSERIEKLHEIYTDKSIPHKIFLRNNKLSNIVSSMLLRINNIYFSDLFYKSIISLFMR